MMRKRSFSVVLVMILLLLVLGACDLGTASDPGVALVRQGPDANATTGVATRSPTNVDGVQATASVATDETTTAESAAEAGSSIPPPDLRTDLQGATVTYVTGATTPTVNFAKRMGREFTALTGIEVRVQSGPESATERLAHYLLQLGAESSAVDVYEIDVIWPGIMEPHAVDLSPVLEASDATFFEPLILNNTVGKKLVGIPYDTGAGLLYYRTDLLQKYDFDSPPQTWAELEAMARTIQEGERRSNLDFWGFVWQGDTYEGLTCNAFEWQVSQGGGLIIEADGTISVNNAQVVAALERAHGWVGTISPQDVVTYQEEDARGIWQSGNAAFMRNWPYAFALGQAKDSAIRDRFDVTLLPKGEGANATSASVLGGSELMVSRYSQHQEAAIELVKFLTSPYGQQQHAIALATPPTIAEVYNDPQVVAANPFFPQLLPVFQGGAVARPSTVTSFLYGEVSNAYFTAVNRVLTGEVDAETSVERLEETLKQILE